MLYGFILSYDKTSYFIVTYIYVLYNDISLHLYDTDSYYAAVYDTALYNIVEHGTASYHNDCQLFPVLSYNFISFIFTASYCIIIQLHVFYDTVTYHIALHDTASYSTMMCVS